MKKSTGISTLLVLAATLLLLSACERRGHEGIPVSFNEGWLFIRQDSVNADKILPGIIPNHKWEEVSLPHSAFTEPLAGSEKQWTGICWYKKLYRPDKRQRHSHTGLLFDGAMLDAIVYLNGAEVARHTGGSLPFYVNLTDDLWYGKENELLVRLDNRENPAIPPGKPLIELGFLWYSGLYRNVSLFVTDRLHITSSSQLNAPLGGGIIIGAREVSRESATLTVSAHMSNDDRTPRSFRMKNSLLDAAGLEVASSLSELTELDPGQSLRLMTRMIVMQPSLWTPETPFLYTVRTELQSENGATIDVRETRTGIRTVRVIPGKGLLLNGQPVKLIGINRHQEYPYIGFALSDNASYRDAFKIREAGFNTVRSSHYSLSPAFLDACDELGLMVINSVPGWKFMGDSLFSEAFIYDTRLMCRRDRNHPAVVMWEASLDETLMSVNFVARLRQAVEEELPFGNNLTCCPTDTACDLVVPGTEDSDIMDVFRLPKSAYWLHRNQQNKGAVVAPDSVPTPGHPVSLRLSADFSNKPLRGDGADAVFVYAELIDSIGNPVHTADSLVEFTVRGVGELIGSNPVRAESGIASILLRGVNPGKVMIKAASAGMSEAELMTVIQ